MSKSTFLFVFVAVAYMGLVLCGLCQTMRIDSQDRISIEDTFSRSYDEGSVVASNYAYHGYVLLYDEDGECAYFPCYEVAAGIKKGCYGVIQSGIFHEIEKGKWITINGIKYKV